MSTVTELEANAEALHPFTSVAVIFTCHDPFNTGFTSIPRIALKSVPEPAFIPHDSPPVVLITIFVTGTGPPISHTTCIPATSRRATAQGTVILATVI